MTDRELLELIAKDISIMKTQQSEHGEILQALRRASEVHNSKLNTFEIEMARLTGKIEGLSTDINYLVRNPLKMLMIFKNYAGLNKVRSNI